MKRWAGMVMVALMAVAVPGCEDDAGDDGDDGTVATTPAVEVSGNWDALADGAALGTMTLSVKANGVLTGTLVTVQGALARLSGTLDGLTAQFEMVFPDEAYIATVTFSADGSSASGGLSDGAGFSQSLRLTRQAAATVPAAT